MHQYGHEHFSYAELRFDKDVPRSFRNFCKLLRNAMGVFSIHNQLTLETGFENLDPHAWTQTHQPHEKSSRIQFRDRGQDIKSQPAKFGENAYNAAHEMFIHAIECSHRYSSGLNPFPDDLENFGHRIIFDPPDESNNYHQFVKMALSFIDMNNPMLKISTKDDELAIKKGFLRRYAGDVLNTSQAGAAHWGTDEDDSLYEAADTWAAILLHEAQDPCGDFWKPAPTEPPSAVEAAQR